MRTPETKSEIKEWLSKFSSEEYEVKLAYSIFFILHTRFLFELGPKVALAIKNSDIIANSEQHKRITELLMLSSLMLIIDRMYEAFENNTQYANGINAYILDAVSSICGFDKQYLYELVKMFRENQSGEIIEITNRIDDILETRFSSFGINLAKLYVQDMSKIAMDTLLISISWDEEEMMDKLTNELCKTYGIVE
ncbi:hypothetical protein ACFL6K_04005 [Candidatus Latescibacterota bacterium]